MKKNLKFVFILIVIVLFLGIMSACTPDTGVEYAQTVYDISVSLEDSTLIGTEEVLITNNDDTPLTCLKFNLYPNAYREDAEYFAVLDSDIGACFYNGASFGGITISDISVEGHNVTPEYDNDGITMILPLDSPINRGEKVSVFMNFKVDIPVCTARLGITETGVNMGNFYPQLCFYENGEYYTNPYYNIGDPFVSDVADYYVEFTAPSSQTIITSGQTQDSYNKNGVTVMEIEAENTRDFAAVALNNANCVSERVGSTDVNLYYTSNNYDKFLETSAAALEFYNESFGTYPFPELNVVETDFIYGGMEYSNLVFIARDLGDGATEYTIAHEIAHQWWYGVVGNNAVEEAWLDEGLTEFSTALYFKNRYGDQTFDSITGSALKSYAVFKNAATNEFGNMRVSLDEYPTSAAYTVIAYDKGMSMFTSIYNIMGEKNFLKALKIYYKDNKFSIATEQDLIAALSSRKEGISNIMDSWLSGKEIIGR